MNDRRSFVRTLAGGATASALASLAAARGAFAESLAALAGGLQEHGFAGLGDAYMLSPDVLYLNHASIGTIPRAVYEARARYLTLCESNPHLYMWGEAWQAPKEEVRAKAAALLRCTTEEVAITHNTTEGFNLLAQGLALQPGDEILFSTLNHSGASVPWRQHGARRGYSVRQFEFPIPDIPGMTAQDVVDTYAAQVRPETRVLVFPHVDNIVGLRYPVRALADAARARGVTYIAVDAAQSVGMLPVDVSAMGVDFLATSPHKWLQAPKGLGLFYARRAVQEKLAPMWVSSGQARFRGTAGIYDDYGTRNLAEVLTLGDAIDFQQELGAEAKAARHRAVWQRMRDFVGASPLLTWRSSRDWELASGLYGIEVNGQSSAGLLERLGRERGFVFRAFRVQGIDSMRISPNVQTRDEEIAAFLETIGG
jgi:selenocysteine lyase/cysteine desulfurase